VTRDHQLLVRRDHPGGRLRAGGADARAAAGIGVCIHVNAEPGRITADTLANRRRVLADPGGEDDRIKACEGGRERAELAPGAVDE